MVSPLNCFQKVYELPLPALLTPSQPSTDVLYQRDHLLKPWHVVIVNLVTTDISVELPVVVLHLTAQVVDHVVDVARVAVFILKELCHMVNFVPVHGFAAWN